MECGPEVSNFEEGAEKSVTRTSGYQKRRGFATTSGQDYEVALCCLLFLRALRLTSDFFLACNHHFAGTFDDIVLIYKFKGEQSEKYRAILLQAKHKERIKEKTLSLSNPFRLLSYLESFKEIRSQWETSVNVENRLIELQEISLILYTNTGCIIGDTAVDVTDFSEVRHLCSFLNTQGRLLRISNAQKIGLPQRTDTYDFLRRLLLCTEQTSTETVDSFIVEEICKYFMLKQSKDAYKLNSELKRVVKEWWAEEGNGRFITPQSEEWKYVLGLQMRRLNSDTINIDRQLNIDFTKEALDEFNVVHRCVKKSWISVRDDYQATVTRTKLFKSRRNSLILDSKFLDERLEEVEALWGTAVCQTLVVDMIAGILEHVSLLKRLQRTVNTHANKYLVIIAKGEPTSTDWTIVKAGTTWSALNSTTRERLLSEHVEFQGNHVGLHNVIHSDVSDFRFDEFINLLCIRKTPIKLGKMIPSPLKYYVPRCLQRIWSKTFNFDSLKDTNTLIFSIHYVPPEVAFINRFKILTLSDLEDTNKIKGPTYVEGVHLKSEMRKLSSKYRVRGICGSIEDKGFKSNVMEFISFTWILEEKIVVIDGVPGVGKSSFVTAMCFSVKERFPYDWVLRIDMGKQSDYIKEREFKKCIEVKEFLLRSISVDEHRLERDLLEHSLDVTGNVFIFLDAFDEISTDYTVKCCNILKGIAKMVRFRQMVVTTRPVTRKEVEDSLGSKAFSLPVFSTEEQILFLKRFSEARGKNVAGEEISSLSFSAGSVLEIPLLCKMAAEVLLYRHDHILLKGVNPWRKVLLYNLFVEQWIEQRLVEKFGLESFLAGTRKIVEYNKKQHLQNLQELAARKLLPFKERSVFDFTTEMPEEKFGVIVNTGKTVEFEHNTFSEFFFGFWLAEHWKDSPEDFIKGVFFQNDFDFVASTFSWKLFDGLPLHSAVAHGDEVAVRELLSSGTVERMDRGGRSPLHVAAMTQGMHREVWELLMSSGEDFNKKDHVLLWSPIKYAEILENWEMVDFLLMKGGSPKALKFIKDKKAALEVLLQIIKKDLTSIFLSILRHHEKIIHVKYDSLKNTLLHIVAVEGSIGIAKVLVKLRHPVNVKNIDGNTPLHEAARCGHLQLVRFLLENGADQNIKNKDDHVPLILGALKGHPETVKLLIDNGADLNIKDSLGGTALIVAAWYGHLETVRILLENGADPNIKNNNGRPSLMLATRNGHHETVRALLERGADPNIYNDSERSPLMLAARNGYHKTVRALLEGGADPNINNNNGIKALMQATWNGHLKTVMLFTERGADPNRKDEKGNTALILAARKGHEEIMKHLLTKGADPSVTDAEGKTVFEYCTEGMMKLLSEQRPHNTTDYNNDSRETLL